MTIINSVIGGGSGGDEVEAYALGSAKDAQPGDKVVLTFTADTANIQNKSPVESLEIIYTDEKYAYGSAYDSNSFTEAMTSYYTKDNGELAKYIGPTYGQTIFLSSCLPVVLGKGLVCFVNGDTDAGYLFSCVNGVPSCLIPNMLASGDVTSVSEDGESVVFNKTLYVRNQDGFRKVANLTRGYGAILPYDDEHLLWVDFAGYVYKVNKVTGSTSQVSTFSFPGDNYITYRHNVVLGNLIIGTGKAITDLLCFDVSVKDTTVTLVKNNAATGSLITLLGSAFTYNKMTSVNVLDGNLIACSYQGSGTDVKMERYSSLRLKYIPEESRFDALPSPYSDLTKPTRVSYGADNTFCSRWYTYPSVRRLIAPRDIKYTAMKATAPTAYLYKQSLTGFVKENNNGILKVSTVIDKNNPAPVVPYPDGFSTRVNYGSSGNKLNVTVSGATVSGTNVSGFNSNKYFFAFTDNPFKHIVEESGEPVINGFELVIPITITASSYERTLACLGGLKGTGWGGLYLTITSAEKVKAYIHYTPDGVNTTVNLTGSTTLTANKKYWVKLAYGENTGYRIELSTDGVYYTTDATLSDKHELYVGNSYLLFGRSPSLAGTNYNFYGTIHFSGAYLEINAKRYWSGIAPNFGSVGVGAGRYLQADGTDVLFSGGFVATPSDDKRDYVMYPYIVKKGTSVNAILSAINPVGYDSFHKISKPVYLWHNLGYLSSAIPETLEPEVTSGSGEVDTNVTIVGSPTMTGSGDVSGFSTSNYLLTIPEAPLVGAKSWEAVFDFTYIGNGAVQVLYSSGSGWESRLSITSGGLVELRINVTGDSTYAARITDTTALEEGTRYIYKAVFTGSVYELYLAKKGESFNLIGSQASTDVLVDRGDHWRIGENALSGNEYPFAGTIHLPGCYINVEGSRVWTGAVVEAGTVSLPVSWKHIDGTLYEYPSGYPATQAGTITSNPTLPGSNSLYVTKTGSACGFAISSATPTGVDSSAVIGTVELDGNGVITSYTPK